MIAGKYIFITQFLQENEETVNITVSDGNFTSTSPDTFFYSSAITPVMMDDNISEASVSGNIMAHKSLKQTCTYL